MAQRLALATGQHYVAGMWESAFPRGLEWYLAFPIQESLRDQLARCEAEDYVGPSWCWAVTKGESPILPIRAAFQSECEVHAAWSNPLSPWNPFGRITDAEIQVRGFAIRLPSGLRRGTPGTRIQQWMVDMPQYQKVWCHLDWRDDAEVIPLRGKLWMLLLSSWSKSPGFGPETFVEPPGRTVSNAGSSYSRIEHLHEKATGFREVVGLLLHPASRDGKYVRVGMFTTCEHGLKGFRAADSTTSVSYDTLHKY
jgi:hypothetical protein